MLPYSFLKLFLRVRFYKLELLPEIIETSFPAFLIIPEYAVLNIQEETEGETKKPLELRGFSCEMFRSSFPVILKILKFFEKCETDFWSIDQISWNTVLFKQKEQKLVEQTSKILFVVVMLYISIFFPRSLDFFEAGRVQLLLIMAVFFRVCVLFESPQAFRYTRLHCASPKGTCKSKCQPSHFVVFSPSLQI